MFPCYVREINIDNEDKVQEEEYLLLEGNTGSANINNYDSFHEVFYN